MTRATDPAATRLAVPTGVGREEVARVREALTPHGETKAAYMGEFSWTQWLPDQNGVEQGYERVVPWDTIKEIMAAIRERAGVDKLDEADALSLLSHAEAGGVEVPSGALPDMIGRVHLGERASSGETLCSYSHTVPAGHPLYWPERMGEYPDDMDPLCLAHAIEQAENDAGWCLTCSAREFEDDDLAASPAAVAGGEA